MTDQSWPDDADGQVLDRLVSNGFDFSKAHDIDFIVDFSDWPPSEQAVSWLKEHFGNADLHYFPENEDGYVRFVVHGNVSYPLVTQIQKDVSEAMVQYHGICDSWGVLHGGAA